MSRHFRGRPGHSYEFRVAAFDRANNRGVFATDRVIVPFDDRDRAVRFSHGWKRLRSSGAWGRRLVRSTRKGASARLSFSGRRVALIGRKLRRGGKLLVSVDGRRKVLSMSGRPRQRSLLYLSAPRGSGRHTLRMEALGGGPVEIDALAPVS